MKTQIRLFILLLVSFTLINSCDKDDYKPIKDTIVDHRCTNLDNIPRDAIIKARTTLQIAYFHSNTGGQILTGMEGLIRFKGTLYDFSNNKADSVLFITDQELEGAEYIGNPDFEEWAEATRSFLKNNDTINVIMWSWGNQISDATAGDITDYLNLMQELENEFPSVKFVYMTGRLEGEENDVVSIRNKQIRDYCKENDKFLYDFADIESYDPDGNYYGDKLADGFCNYDADNDGKLEITEPSEENGWQTLPEDGDKNWAIEWQNSHMEDIDWYDCYAPGTQPLNANQKAYAAWWLWARLGGWDGK